MAFPGTYNINYYLGDTQEFKVYPKNNDGSPFDLTDFSAPKFIIAQTRGAEVADQIAAYAEIATDPSGVHLLCAIRPEDAAKMDPSVQYVYDIEIVLPSSTERNNKSYDIVHTVLTGNLTITQDITTEESGAPEPLPNNPTNLVIGNITDTTIQVSWTAPTAGGAVENYRIAIIPYTTDSNTLVGAITSSTTEITSDNTSTTFFGLSENTDYSILILSVNESGTSDVSGVLTNSQPVTTGDNPNTVEPDIFVTNDGSSAYLVDGVENDTITVVRGETYVINVDATGHPFWIQTIPSSYSPSDAYNEGVANNGTDNGNIIWSVSESAPDTLFYVCQFHASNMGGTITVIDGGS